MSFKRRLFAAATTLALVGGAGAAATMTAATADAATPSCGHGCIDIFSKQFGTHNHPNFILDIFKQSAKAGTPVILFQASNNDPAEDITASFQGTVVNLFKAGLVSSALALHYGCVKGVDFASCPKPFSTNDPAFELQYAPFGAPTGMCVGVATTAANGTPVTLVPCGVSGRSFWVLDTIDGKFADFGTHQFPLINGSNNNFSHPYVLTYPFGKNPVDKPRPVLETANLTGFAHGVFPELTTINSNQLWSARFGVIP